MSVMFSIGSAHHSTPRTTGSQPNALLELLTQDEHDERTGPRDALRGRLLGNTEKQVCMQSGLLLFVYQT
jgi:hypothetical protein